MLALSIPKLGHWLGYGSSCEKWERRSNRLAAGGSRVKAYHILGLTRGHPRNYLLLRFRCSRYIVYARSGSRKFGVRSRSYREVSPCAETLTTRHGLQALGEAIGAIDEKLEPDWYFALGIVDVEGELQELPGSGR